MLFKPFTHVAVADDVWLDAINGSITVEGQDYTLDSALVTALQNQKPSFLAGSIGPDGFPDPVFGQAIVHPDNTGLWLTHVLTSAWDAQTDPRYANAPAEREKILAWSYGFLVHAAGDVWSHTLVNHFAGGPFPDIGSSVPQGTVVEDVQNAVRHLAVEAYFGDATPGFDGNPDRQPVVDRDGQPVLNSQGQQDFSDDGSWGIPLDAPHQFIYDTLIAEDTIRPVADQGLLLDFFFDLRGQLQQAVGAATPQVFQLSTDVLSQASTCLSLAQFDAAACARNFPADVGELLLASTRSDLISAVGIAYLRNWLDDIDQGLEHWSELGLAVTKGLFDPQAKRDYQNELCQNEGSETSQLRIDCEDSVGLLDVVIHEIGVDEIGDQKFFNRYLLPMMGVPEIIVDVRNVLGEIGQQFGQFLDTLTQPINPILEAVADVEQKVRAFIEEKAFELVEAWIGFDVQAFLDLMDNPSGMIDLLSYDITIGGQTVSVPLFASTAHAELDGLLGITHQGAGPLGDNVTFNADTFAVYKNAVTMSKLALLDGNGVDAVVRTLKNDPSYSFYGPRDGNIMTTPLAGVELPNLNVFAAASQESRAEVQARNETALRQWLTSIDASWAWQTPQYEIENGQLVTDYGGLGNFPLYHDTAVRNDVFLTLFDDWLTDDGMGNPIGNLVPVGNPTPPPRLADPLNAAAEDELATGLDEVVTWLYFLETMNHLGQPLPLIVDGDGIPLAIADLLDLSNVFDQYIATPVVDYLNQPGVGTSVEIVKLLKSLGGTFGNLAIELVPVSIGGGPFKYFGISGATKEEARYELHFRATQKGVYAVDLGERAANDFGLRGLDKPVQVTTTMDFDVAFGVDVTGSQADFFLDVRDFSVSAEMDERTYDADLRVGFFGLEVYHGAIEMNAALAISPVAGVRLNFSQLSTSPAMHVAEQVLADDMHLELPITAGLGSFKGFLTAAGIMNVKADTDDVFSGTGLTTNVYFFDELLDFNHIDGLTFVGLLNVMKEWFDSLTLKSIIDLLKDNDEQRADGGSGDPPVAQEDDKLPIVGKSVDEVLDLGSGFAFDLIEPLVDDNERPEFVTAQDLGSLIGEAIDQHSSFDYDPVTKDLTYTLGFQHVFPLLEDESLDFGATALGGLVGVETSSTINIEATVDYQFTIGINLNLEDSVIVAPRTAASDGRLTAPAKFRLTIFDNDTSQGDPAQGPLATTREITVVPDPTNNSLRDLVQDLNAAFAVAGFGARVLARQNSDDPTRLELVGIGADKKSVMILKSGHGAAEAPTDPNDPTVTQLGFDDLHANQGALLDGLFLEDASFAGSIGFAADDIDASAFFGLAELAISEGTAVGSVNLDFSLVDPTTQTAGGRVFIDELFQSLYDTAAQIVDLQGGSNLSGSLDVVLPLQATVFGQQISGDPPNDPRIEVHWSDIFRESPEVQVLNADQLAALEKITFEGIVGALREIASILTELQGESLYGIEIPGLGVSLGQLFDYAERLAGLADQMLANPAFALSQLEAAIEAGLGLDDSDLALSLAEQGTVLRIDLTLGADFSAQVPLHFDLVRAGSWWM